MYSLRLFSWALFAVAGLCLVTALATEELIFIPASVSSLATGLMFLAADKALLILGEIRDAVSGHSKPLEHSEAVNQVPTKPARSIEEISSDLKAMKQRVVD